MDELFGTIEAVKKAPVIATFRFRARNRWIDGGHNRTFVKNFRGIQQEQERKEGFVLEADEPPLLLGRDLGPNPVEYALTALAACVTTSIVYHAAAKGVRIRSLESRLEGDIDLQKFLGLNKDVPRGYREIRMFVFDRCRPPAGKAPGDRPSWPDLCAGFRHHPPGRSGLGEPRKLKRGACPPGRAALGGRGARTQLPTAGRRPEGFSWQPIPQPRGTLSEA